MFIVFKLLSLDNNGYPRYIVKVYGKLFIYFPHSINYQLYMYICSKSYVTEITHKSHLQLRKPIAFVEVCNSVAKRNEQNNF